MSIYIIPSTGNPEDLLTAASRARVPVIQVKTVREYILATHEVAMAIAIVPTEVLLILNRHASTLLSELPSAVFAVPGLIYDAGWNTYATAYPAVDAGELMSKLAKSGRLATDPQKLQDQDQGALISDASLGARTTTTRATTTRSPVSRLSFTSTERSSPVDDDENDGGVDAEDLES